MSKFFVTMCIGRENLAMPATVLCAKRIAESMDREFLWMDQDGIGITVYLNQLVRRTSAALGPGRSFYALMTNDDIRVDPSYAHELAVEFEMAETSGYDLMTPAPIRRPGFGSSEWSSNITKSDGVRLSMDQVRELPKYARYGKDFWGGAISFYYGRFDPAYVFHEDDKRDESFYFINDQKKDVRLLPHVKVGHYKRVLLE